MSRLERAKVWAKAHKEDLMIGGMFAGLGVATVAMFVLIYKADVAASERRTAELNKAIDELNDWYKYTAVDAAYNTFIAEENAKLSGELVDLAEKVVKANKAA